MHIVFSLTKYIFNLFMHTSHISGKEIFQRIPDRVEIITIFDIPLSVCQHN